MRIIALVASHNERRFIRTCLDHLIAQGVEVYLIDNESDDETVKLAQKYLGRGLLAIETLPRRTRHYEWQPILQRKEELASQLAADWFIHVDPDEIRLAPPGCGTLKDAICKVDAAGYNAINFTEYTFVPTRESPDHDHKGFLRTMRWYYPHRTGETNQLKAWKRQPSEVGLAATAGHRVDFPALRKYPLSFPMRHYLFLSPEHAYEKYVQRVYDPNELAKGWHRARASLCADAIVLQSAKELRYYWSDDQLDPSNPLQRHPLFVRTSD